MTLFRQKYRAESTRMPGWDYRTAGYYFVTICTKEREHFFGDVVDGAMVLSDIGNVIASEWKGIAVRRREVEVDEWVLMPNHLHAIVVLNGAASVETPQRRRNGVRTSNDNSLVHRASPEQTQRGVSTAARIKTSDRFLEQPFKEAPQHRRNGVRTSDDTLVHRASPEQTQRGVSTRGRLRAGSLGAIIGQFKSRATKRVWRSGNRAFRWQERFYDHVIRDEDSLISIRQYIIDNPLKWELDKDNVENLYM